MKRLLLLLLIAAPVAAEPSEKFKRLKSLIPGSDDQPATVAGTRGLEESTETPDTTVRDFAAVERLEAISISEADLKTFIKEGKLR